MKPTWTDQDIEKALRGMRGERPRDPNWADRVWTRIEVRLEPREGGIASWFRPKPVRWAVVAACLMLGFVLNVQHRSSEERDLGAYVADLCQANSIPDEAEITEPILLTDGTGLMNVGYEEDEETEPTVYDTMMEI